MTDQLQLLLRQLTTQQRIGVGVAAIASIALLLGLVMWAGRPDLQPAFTRLTTEDAAGVSDALRTAKIPFELADAGSTILVPSSQLANARVAAGQAGVATGGSTGFELFDQEGFGSSEFDQQVTYQRALEGKLEQTIEQLNGVSNATVSIVQAERGLFADQQQPASAGVLLEMRPGSVADAAMVRGIVGSVAAAVAGLVPDNVTVVDSAGRILHGPDAAAGSDAATVQAGVERNLEAKVQTLVDQALGPGHATVAVSAEVNLDRVEQEITTVSPITEENWTPTSVQRVDETYAGTAAGAGGIPGAESNVPGLPTYPGTVPAASGNPAADGGDGTGYVRRQETVNYANSQTVERIIREPGAVERVSVAVLLDEGAIGSVAPANLASSIEAAIGADPSRGDVVSVSAVPFADATALDGAGGGAGELLSTVGDMTGSILAGLAAVALLVLVWMNLKALGRRADEMQISVSAAEQGLLGAGPAGPGYDATGLPAAALAMPIASPEAILEDRLRTSAAQNPEPFVGLVNTWLRQDER